jgi:hypothetical protein
MFAAMVPEIRAVQVYWESVSDFAKQPMTIKSEFLKQLPMFGGLSSDLLLFMACIVEYALTSTLTTVLWFSNR